MNIDSFLEKDFPSFAMLTEKPPTGLPASPSMSPVDSLRGSGSGNSMMISDIDSRYASSMCVVAVLLITS